MPEQDSRPSCRHTSRPVGVGVGQRHLLSPAERPLGSLLTSTLRPQLSVGPGAILADEWQNWEGRALFDHVRDVSYLNAGDLGKIERPF